MKVWVIAGLVLLALVVLAPLVVMVLRVGGWSDNPSGWGDPCAAVSDDYASAVIDWRYTMPGVGTIASGRCAP